MLGHSQRPASLPEFLQALTETISAATGFNRVMVYHFLPDGSGSVDAETCHADAESFLGLRFPASDIPQQARALYLRTRLRLIPDVAAIPAPLLPEINPTSSLPLDLSDSVLRSVSPTHIEYLTNMGVRASMSVSIMLRGQLWGMIVCHHGEPKLLPHWLRVACELFAETAAFQLEARLTAQDYEAAIRGKQIYQDLIGRLIKEPDIMVALACNLPELMDYMPADGAALWSRQLVRQFGRTPGETEIGNLVNWLNTQDIRIFATDRLGSAYSPAIHFAAEASGLLALSLPTAPVSYVLLFREEVIQSVSWAGNPHKPFDVGLHPPARLTPRKSFAAWQETMRMQSRAWSLSEIEAAEALRLALLEMVLRQTDLAMREQARQRQDMVMADLNHRVKNMLATVRALVSQSEASADTIKSFVTAFEGRLLAMSRAHALLTTNRWEGSDLHALISEGMAPFIDGNLPQVIMNGSTSVPLRSKAALAFSLALHELATNAIKYGALSVLDGKVHIDWRIEHRDGPVLLLHWRESGGPPVSPPTRRGFGRSLIETNLPYEIGGTVKLDFLPEGLSALVEAPWNHITTTVSIPQLRLRPVDTAASLTGSRVLVVEDNGLVATSIITALKRAGALVVGPAARLIKALELAETAQIDVAILDIDLDGHKIWPVADSLSRRNIPFVFCSGYHTDMVVPPHCKGRPTLDKPFTTDALHSALMKLLQPASRDAEDRVPDDGQTRPEA